MKDKSNRHNMKRLITLIQKWLPKEPLKPLGRWSNEYCDTKTNQRIDLSNEDHCGPCGQYLISKTQPKNDKRDKKEGV